LQFSLQASVGKLLDTPSYMPQAGSEPVLPLFQWSETVSILDRMDRKVNIFKMFYGLIINLGSSGLTVVFY